MKTIDIDAALRRHEERQMELQQRQQQTANDRTTKLREQRKRVCRCPFDATALVMIKMVRDRHKNLIGYEVGCPRPSCDFTMVAMRGSPELKALMG